MFVFFLQKITIKIFLSESEDLTSKFRDSNSKVLGLFSIFTLILKDEQDNGLFRGISLFVVQNF